MSDERSTDTSEVETDYQTQAAADVEHDEDNSLLDRRNYLKLAGAAVATVATTSSVSANNGTTRQGITFDRVLDAVDDLGLDPSGGAAVNDRLESALSEGTLIRFPAGEYQFDDQIIIEDDRVGFVGDGDVRFVPPTGFSDFLFNYVSPPDDVLIENVDIDMRADETTTGIRLRCRNHFHIQDIELLGRGLIDNSGQVSAFLVAVANEGGRGVLRNAVAKKGSRVDGYARGNGRIGVWVGWSNKGTVRIEDCDFREFGNNGTYTSRTPGQVEIVDCYFLNNNAANVRIGGEGSYVENCTVEIDFEKYTGPPLGDLSTGFGMRGVQIEQGVQLEGAESIPAGAEVRNCEIIGTNAPNGIAMVNLSPQGRSLNIENTRIKCDIDGMWAVRRGEPGTIDWREYQSTPPKPHWIRMDGVSITGSAAGKEAVHLVEADGSIIRNCCIHQSGSNRNGVHIVDATDCIVEDSTIDVTGTAIDLENATADTSAITQEGSCPLPNADGTTSDTSGTTSDTPDGSKLEIDGGGVYERVEYTFTVDGTVEPGDRANDNDLIDGSTVTGQVEGGVDSFWVTGEFTEFQLGGDVIVRLDGEEVDPATLVTSDDSTSTDSGSTDSGSTDSGTTAHELVIDGGNTYERIEYTFTVDGTVEPGEYANPSDSIDGGTVTGHVEGGKDSFLVTGEFTAFQLDGDIPVRLDGEEVDPAALVIDEPAQREFVIDGSVTTDRVPYTFSVDGTVEPGDRANASDSIEGSSVSGQVEGGKDSFLVTGEFTNFQMDGDVPLLLDGTEVDPATLNPDHELPNELVITGTNEGASYQVETTGSVAKRGGMWGAEASDSADGAVASGTVTDDRDTFGFSGDIVQMQIDGDAAVTFSK